MDQRKILPFYMTYPLPLYYEDEHEMIKDMEYLQDQNPIQIRTLKNEIAKSMNMLDYRGSMIYDEYPDRFMLQKYGKDTAEKIRFQYRDKKESPIYPLLNWDGFDTIIMLLVNDEILMRRHRKNKGFLKF